MNVLEDTCLLETLDRWERGAGVDIVAMLYCYGLVFGFVMWLKLVIV